MKLVWALILLSCCIASGFARGRVSHRDEFDSDENELQDRPRGGWARAGRNWRHGGNGWVAGRRSNDETEPTVRRFGAFGRPSRRHHRHHHHRHHTVCDGSESGNWTMEAGVMFTQDDDMPSLLTYQTPEQSNRSESQYSVEFRTTEDNGLIFMGACPWKKDLFALFLKDGELSFAFNCGTGTAYLSTGKLTLNDGLWHSVHVMRVEQNAVMMVDDVQVAEGSSPGNATELNPSSKVYLGTVPPKMWKRKGAMKDLRNLAVPFKGCLKNFLISEELPTQVVKECGLSPCVDESNEIEGA